jgi:hypothetical protein
MIAWVDEQCRSWGAHKRWLVYGEHGWPPRSILGKLIEEGPGAGESVFVARVPIHDDPPAYTAVNVALQKMAETHEMYTPWIVVHAHYVVGGKAKTKAPDIGVSLPQYWRLLHAAHAFISACDVPRESDSYTRNIRAAAVYT